MATSGGEELLAACHALFGALWLIPPVLLRGGWKSLGARRHLQLIVNALNLFSLMLNGLAE